jgi:hypothetical protein
VPAAKPVKFAVAIEPVIIAPPGLAVTVHAAAGNPLNATLPVATLHVGCVTVPTTGADGVTGWTFIVADVEETEVHPEDVNVTVKVYVPAANPEKFAVVEEPVIVAPPGLAVTVQAVVGKPLKATLPVATAHVGWVIAPITGDDGVTGCALIIADVEDPEVHPEDVNVTANVYVPAGNPEKVAVAVEPVIVAPPGVAVTVHAVVGKPLKAIIPVATAHVGWVIVPTIGTDGVMGCTMMITGGDDTVEMQFVIGSVTVQV